MSRGGIKQQGEQGETRVYHHVEVNQMTLHGIETPGGNA